MSFELGKNNADLQEAATEWGDLRGPESTQEDESESSLDLTHESERIKQILDSLLFREGYEWGEESRRCREGKKIELEEPLQDADIEAIRNSDETLFLSMANTRGLTSEQVGRLAGTGHMINVRGGLDYLNIPKYRSLDYIERSVYTPEELAETLKCFEGMEAHLHDDWTDRQKALFLDFCLQRDITYVTSGENCRSLRGVQEGELTCAGIALTYAEVCQRNGIDVSYCNKPNLHSFNVLHEDGKNYGIDLTWDLSKAKNGPKLNNFCNDERFGAHKAHLIDEYSREPINYDYSTRSSEEIMADREVIMDEFRKYKEERDRAEMEEKERNGLSDEESLDPERSQRHYLSSELILFACAIRGGKQGAALDPRYQEIFRPHLNLVKDAFGPNDLYWRDNLVDGQPEGLASELMKRYDGSLMTPITDESLNEQALGILKEYYNRVGEKADFYETMPLAEFNRWDETAIRMELNAVVNARDILIDKLKMPAEEVDSVIERAGTVLRNRREATEDSPEEIERQARGSEMDYEQAEIMSLRQVYGDEADLMDKVDRALATEDYDDFKALYAEITARTEELDQQVLINTIYPQERQALERNSASALANAWTSYEAERNQALPLDQVGALLDSDEAFLDEATRWCSMPFDQVFLPRQERVAIFKTKIPEAAKLIEEERNSRARKNSSGESSQDDVWVDFD